MTGYYLLKWPKQWLLLCSMFFYGHWNPKYVFLIGLSIIINYLICNRLTVKKSKYNFILGLMFNLGLLGFFKYYDFFIINLNGLTSQDFNVLKILLPLGISFFTLQQIAYLIDTYEGLVTKKSFLDYSIFVSFFPQLIAGPIVHYSEMMPQLEKRDCNKFQHKNFSLGLYIFSLGLFKKVLVADTFAVFANTGFSEVGNLHLLFAWGTSLSYSMQLYFDFSGYSDMAIGIAYLFNIKLPENFNSPFKSKNIVEFWTRWHITLSSFITTYIFTPIVRAMPKLNFFTMMLSSFITMTIAGLWHGAAWSFVVYGMMHGGAIIINHLWKKYGRPFPSMLSWFLAFNYINICFVMFRANDPTHALKIYKGMFGLTGFQFPKGIVSKSFLRENEIEIGSYMTGEQNLILLMLVVCFIGVWKMKNSTEQIQMFNMSKSYAFRGALMFVISIFGLNRVTEFIYFNF